MNSQTPFDDVAEEYDAKLGRGLDVSGEGKEYFAQHRVRWCKRCLENEGGISTIMDYGCGTGTAMPFLLEEFHPDFLVGVDMSRESLAVAQRDTGSAAVQFIALDEHRPAKDIDLVYCNGVFHHIPSGERGEAVDRIRRSLRPGGWFSFWENNPWNPGARLVMKRISFDRDTVPLSAPVARDLLRAHGFRIVQTDFLFIFPHVLRRLRGLEPLLARLPLGAQYQVLARREE